MHLGMRARITIPCFCGSFCQRRNIFIDSHRTHLIPNQFHARIQSKRLTKLIVAIQIGRSHPHSITLGSLHHRSKVACYPPHFRILLCQGQPRMMFSSTHFCCVRHKATVLRSVIPSAKDGFSVSELRHPIVSRNQIRHRLLKIQCMFDATRFGKNLCKQICLRITRAPLQLRIVIHQYRVATV